MCSIPDPWTQQSPKLNLIETTRRTSKLQTLIELHRETLLDAYGNNIHTLSIPRPAVQIKAAMGAQDLRRLSLSDQQFQLNLNLGPKLRVKEP